MTHPTPQQGECKHDWKIVSSWGVRTMWMRRECKLCGLRQDGEVENWKETPKYDLSGADTPTREEASVEEMVDELERQIIYHGSLGLGEVKKWLRTRLTTLTSTIREEAKREERERLPEEMLGDSPCSYCGGDVFRWFTDNVYWNPVMRDSLVANERNDKKGDGFCCVSCFVKRAHAAGMRPSAYRLIPEWPWREATPTPSNNDGV